MYLQQRRSQVYLPLHLWRHQLPGVHLSWCSGWQALVFTGDWCWGCPCQWSVGRVLHGLWSVQRYLKASSSTQQKSTLNAKKRKKEKIQNYYSSFIQMSLWAQMNLIESLLTLSKLELSLEASSLLKDAVIKILLSSATDTSSTCVTIDGQPCKFPFKWNDVEYEACTKVDDKNDKPWCGTVSTVSGDGEWAHCDMSSACEGLILILILQTTRVQFHLSWGVHRMCDHQKDTLCLPLWI